MHLSVLTLRSSARLAQSRLLYRLATPILFAAAALLPNPAYSQAVQGVSDTSLGRFAEWQFYPHSTFYGPAPVQLADPLMGRNVRPWEGDLVKRVYPDHIARSHKDIVGDANGLWKFYFGVLQAADDPATVVENDYSAVDIRAVNWVRKRFSVLRKYSDQTTQAISMEECNAGNSKDLSYNLLVGSVAPGTWLQTMAPRFFIHHDDPSNPTTFQYATYMSGSELVDPPISLDGFSLLAEDLEQPWILVWGVQDGTTIPLLLSFSSGLAGITASGEYLICDFELGQENTIGMSLPYGISAFPEGSPGALWADPGSILAQAVKIHMMVARMPSQVAETFAEVPGPGNSLVSDIEITNEFTHDTMPGAIPMSYATLPPLVGFASENSLMDVDISSQLISTEYQTKYGPLLFRADGSFNTYTIPGPAPHDVHLVPTKPPPGKTTVWRERTDRLLNAAASTVVSHELRGDTFAVASSRGETTSLAHGSAGTKSRFVSRMEDIIRTRFKEDVMQQLEPEPAYGLRAQSGQSVGGWSEYVLHATCDPADVRTFQTSIFGDPEGDPVLDEPFDIDASAGVGLAFLYEYLLWSGDVGLLQQCWSGGLGSFTINDVFRPFELLHDWAYMGTGQAVFGGNGLDVDMFSAQYDGLHAYAALANALGHTTAASRGRYLQAKLQLPMLLKWAFKPYVENYYKTLDSINAGTQVIAGFPEGAPSGPLHARSYQRQEAWSDWTISGERMHPLVFEAYHALYSPGPATTPFVDGLLGIYQNTIQLVTDGDQQGIEGTFAESKIWGMYRSRDALGGQQYLRSQLQTDFEFLHAPPRDEAFPKSPFPLYFVYREKSVGPSGWASQQASDGRVDVVGRPTPSYPATMESFGVPARIGAWAPARLLSAEYSVGTGSGGGDELELQFDLTNGGDRVWVQYDEDAEPLSLPNGKDERWDATWYQIPAGGSLTVPFPSQAPPQEIIDPTPNLASAPGFDDLMPGGSHPEVAWGAGDPSVRRAWVEADDSVTPPDPALRILAGESVENRTYIGADQYYTLRFKYRVPLPQTRLQFDLFQWDDRSCDSMDEVNQTVRDDCSLKQGVFAPDHTVRVSKNQETGILFWGPGYREFEVRGKMSQVAQDWDHFPTGPSDLEIEALLLTRFRVVDENSPPVDVGAWIDDFAVELGVPADPPSFVQPPEGAVLALIDDGDTGTRHDEIPIAWYPDVRVKSLYDEVAPTGEDWKVAFSWASYPNGTWTPIDNAEIHAISFGLQQSWNGALLGYASWDYDRAAVHGTIHLRARYHSDSGFTDVFSAPFDVLPQPLVFKDETALTGGAVPATSLYLPGDRPYASLAVDLDRTDPDVDMDLILSFRERQAVYVQNNQPLLGQDIGNLQDQTSNFFAGGFGPLGTRGVSAADIDNDGTLELFMATESDQGAPRPPLLFQKSAGLYTDVAASRGITAADVWAGAWGDLNGDTFCDLYLVRAGDLADDIDPSRDTFGAPGLGRPDLLLRSLEETPSAGFEDATSDPTFVAGLHTEPSPTISANWMDADGDGDRDLFVSWLGPVDVGSSFGWSPLYINNGDNGSGGALFEDVSGSASPPKFGRLGAVVSALFTDVTRDQRLDIVLARDNPDGDNLFVCPNDGADDFTLEQPDMGIHTLTRMHGLAVTDLDGNGILDVIGAPRADVSPIVFQGYDTHDLSHRYTDRGGDLGLGSGEIHTILAVNLNDDTDADLFLGRSYAAGTDAGIVFSNPMATPASAVTVQLVSENAGNNRAGIGSTVMFHAVAAQGDTIRCAQTMDGGTGVGGQNAACLTFGMGTATTATITVRWPNGGLQEFKHIENRPDFPNLIFVDSHDPGILPGTVVGTYVPSSPSTGTSWTVDWETSAESGPIGVIFYVPNRAPGHCYVFPGGSGTTVYPMDSSTPGVTTNSVPIAGTTRWHHTLTYSGVLCEAPCNYTFTVQNDSGDETFESSGHSLNVGVCADITE